MNYMFLAQYYERHMMETQDWGWGFIMMIFFMLIIIASIVVFAKYAISNSSNSDNKEGPMDIAKSRYAKGEITKAQFDEIKKALKS